MEWLGSGSTSSILRFAGVTGGLAAPIVDRVSAMPLSVALGGFEGTLPELGLAAAGCSEPLLC